MGTQHRGKMTAKSDMRGVEVRICDVTWFDAATTYSIPNSPERTVGLKFTADDLNYFSRVLFAEASGSEQLPDPMVRKDEKDALISVVYFRLNRRNYPSYSKINTTFTDICNAHDQFATVYPVPSEKMLSATGNAYRNLIKDDCTDLQEAIDAIKSFFESGPNSKYVYDNFRGGLGDGRRGAVIGKSRFWLSEIGKKMAAETP